jgi:hypothetical protein
MTNPYKSIISLYFHAPVVYKVFGHVAAWFHFFSASSTTQAGFDGLYVRAGTGAPLDL